MSEMSSPPLAELPVAIIGAGPVGMAAAAHCAARGLEFVVLEAGEAVGAHLRDWGHVRLFSPWRYDVDPIAARLLEEDGWVAPDPDGLPTGDELGELYLAPLADMLAAHGRIATGARVVAITRQGVDKVKSAQRAARPFDLRIAHSDGRRGRLAARAVIDASGTWATPNPLGGAGLPAEGEAEAAARIAYRIPDPLGRDRDLYAGAHTLVVGAGHSAANAVIDLAGLASETGGAVLWAVRSPRPNRAFGGGDDDELPARGALGARLKALVDGGRVTMEPGFIADAVRAEADGRLRVTAEDGRRLGPVDRIVALTGQRPDLAMTRELRIDVDPWLECARPLAAEIDPNLHACGSVAPHGHAALAHPEPGFYVAGAKSYGRAPTFLMMTGYEQVRSIVAALAGAEREADVVSLSLPKTGVCNGGGDMSCCGPKPVAASAAAPAKQRSCCGAAA